MATSVSLSKEPSELSISTVDSKDEHSHVDAIVNKCWKFEEVCDLLEIQLAVLPGSRDKNGHSVIVIYGLDERSLLVANMGRILSYLGHIPTETMQGKGFTILLDMRQGTWAMMKKALESLRITFIEHIHQVIIMKPKSMWQRGRSSVNFNLKKSKYKFKCILLEHSSDIFSHISPANVLKAQNGLLDYDHSHWMKIQKIIENLTLQLLSRKEEYSNLLEVLHKQERSLNLEEAKLAVKHHLSLLERIDRSSLDTLVATVLHNVAQLRPTTTNPDFESAFINTEDMCGLLQTTFSNLEELWKRKGDSLDHTLQFKVFENDAATHILWLQDQVSYLSRELTRTGSDVSSAQTYMLLVEEYRKKINDKHTEINHTIEVGQRLVALSHPSSQLIAHQIDEISAKWEILMDSVEERMALMILSVSFHDKEEKFTQQTEHWIDECSSSYYPPNISCTEDAVERHRHLHETFSASYVNARQDGHYLIEKLRRPIGEGSIPVEFIQATRHIKERLESLYDEKNMIDEHWKQREDDLRKTLNFHLFRKESDKIFHWIHEVGNSYLHQNTSIGVDTNSASLLLKSHDNFESDTELAIIYSQFNGLQSHGKELSAKRECRQEEVEKEISKLEEAISNFATRLDERRDILVLSVQCFKASDNFFKEASNIMTSIPKSKFDGTCAELEERLNRFRVHHGILNNIASTTLKLWKSLLERFETSKMLNEASNCIVNYSVAIQTTKKNILFVENEQGKVETVCQLREKRWELSLSRLKVIRDIDDYLTQLDSWIQESGSESTLADNVDDAQLQFDIFERQYNQHLQKQNQLFEYGQEVNHETEQLDAEMFDSRDKPNDSYELLQSALSKLKRAEDKMITISGPHLHNLEECVQYHLLQQRCQKLNVTLNQLSLSLSRLAGVHFKLEDVTSMDQNVKSIGSSLQTISKDVELFSNSVSECLEKSHYQSASLNVLCRTVNEKLQFVKDSLSERQRVVRSAMEFLSNYDKLQSTMEYCQVQFTSRENGQTLSDVTSQQESMKELKQSLTEAVTVVKSQAEQLKSVLGGSGQTVHQLNSEDASADGTPRLLVAPKKIRPDKSSSTSTPQSSHMAIDDLVCKMDANVSRLNRLWDNRLTRLEQSKQIIEFESEVPKVLKWLDEVGANFLKHRHDYGRSSDEVQQLLQEHHTFCHDTITPMLHKVEELRKMMSLFEENGHYELNRIRSIGNHLEQQWLKFDTDVQKRLANLKLSLSFQENLFEGNNWCMQSEQFFNTLDSKINRCDTSDEASSLSAELSIYLSVTKDEQLDRVSKIQQISGFLHSNPLSELAAQLDQNTQQILKDFEVVQQDLESLHAKLSHIEKEKDKEMRLLKQKQRVIEELITTEEVYVKDLQLVVETYKPRFISDFLPESLKGKETIVFGNIQWIAEFHTDVLWPQIQAADSDADLIAQVFIDNVEVMTDLYVPYCKNKTNSEELLASHRSYLNRVSSLFGTDIPLSSLLIKPIQRITKYPLLLTDCLKYTRQLGQPGDLLELAVQAVEEIPIQTNNAIHLSLLKSEEGLKWHKFGELLYQGALLVSEPRLLITSEKERQVFVFENTVVFARRIEHGQAKFSYEYKFRIPLTAGVQVLEFVESEPLKFGLFTSDHRMHLKTSSLDVKQKWIKCLKLAIQKHADEEENKLRSLSLSTARIRSNAVLTGDAVAKDLSEKGYRLRSSPNLPRRPSSPFSTTRVNLPISERSVTPPVTFDRYRVTNDYIPLKDDHHGLSLKKNQIVEVMEQLDTGRSFIQATSITGQVEHGWVPSSLLEAVLVHVHEPLDETDINDSRNRRYTEIFQDKDSTSHQQIISTLKKVTIGQTSTSPKPSKHTFSLVTLTSDETGSRDLQPVPQVSVISKDGSSDAVTDQKSLTPRKFKRKAVVRRRSSRKSESDSQDKCQSSSDDDDVSRRSNSPVISSSVLAEEQLKREKAEEKLRYIMAELYETEKEYVSKLDKLVNGFLHSIQDNSSLPEALQGKEWMIFGNVAAIYEFHKNTFQELLEKAKDSLEAIAQCFLDKRSEFKMYVTYCENKPKSESFIWTYTHQGGTFFKEIQAKLGLREDIASFLIKPVQRITKYQLLLKDLLKSSQKAGHTVPLLEDALQLMQDVPKQANDAMALSMIVGYHGNIHANGQIVLQDEFTVYERSRWAVGAHRHVFLLDLMVIITKEKDNDGLYVFKDSLKVHNMTITEKQADSPCRFAIGTGQIGDWDKYYVLEASSNEKKQEWVRTIKEILNQQFEMLKALKQPNTRVRSGTVDTAVLSNEWENTKSKDTITTQPSVFHDMSDSSLDENSEDEGADTLPLPTSQPQLHDNSNSMQKLFIAGDDCPAPVEGQHIFNLKKGQIYEVVNTSGDWWLAHLIQDVSGSLISPGTEGWVPGSFMEPFSGQLSPSDKPSLTKYSTLPTKLSDSGSQLRSTARTSIFPGLSFKSDARKKLPRKKSKTSSAAHVVKITVPLSDESVLCGHDVQFKCELDAEYTHSKIDWLHNGEVIGKRAVSHTSGRICTLKINNAVPDDEGMYTCKVTIQEQNASTSAKLTVLRRPDPPAQPKIKQITSTSVSLSWNPPSFDGHSPVTVYLVECKDVVGNRWSTLTNRISEPATIVDDLVLGTEYLFRVIAVNHIGCSEPSNESISIQMTSESPVFALEPFEDHYTLMDKIACGQFSSVYECQHKATQQTYVAKLIPLAVGHEHSSRELKILAQLSHPNLVSMSSSYLTDKYFIIVMQYVHGVTVYKYCIQSKLSTEKEVAVLCRQLVHALTYLHERNIAHLAIKPDNILVADTFTGSFKLQVIHFSSAQFVYQEKKISSSGKYIEYEAPEILLEEPVSTATDMWSVGVLLYTLLGGAVPFIADSLNLTKDNIQKVRYSVSLKNFQIVSSDAASLITQALQKRPSRRITSTQFLQHQWMKNCESGSLPQVLLDMTHLKLSN